jgi:hypothetical protein
LGIGGMWKSRWEEENGEAFFLIVFVHVRAKREMSEIQINVLKYKRQVNPYGTFLSLPFPKIELVLFYTGPPILEGLYGKSAIHTNPPKNGPL